MRRMITTALAALVVSAGSVLAQGRPVRPPRDAARLEQRGQQLPPEQRQAMERRIRQALARAVRNRVGLNEDQMRRLEPVNRKYAEQRRALAGQERDVRMALRREMMDTASPDQGKIAAYQNQLIDLQRKRLDLVQAEQTELSSFMTPLQVAKYRALQEQVRRRVEEMRQRQLQQGGTDPFGTAPDTGRR